MERGSPAVINICTRRYPCHRLVFALVHSQSQIFQVRFPAGWCEIPFYVVGQATASALISVFGAYVHLGLTSVDVRGQLSGNATTLASFILEDPDKPSRLLYLTGDKNRDTLTNILQEGGISVEPLQTYKTEGSPSFAEDLSTVIQTSSKGVWFNIFFLLQFMVFTV